MFMLSHFNTEITLHKNKSVSLTHVFSYNHMCKHVCPKKALSAILFIFRSAYSFLERYLIILYFYIHFQHKVAFSSVCNCWKNKKATYEYKVLCFHFIILRNFCSNMKHVLASDYLP